MSASIPDLIEAWVRGWAGSRGTPDPVRVAEGWLVATGTPKETQRYVLPDPTATALAELLARRHPANTCVKVPGDPELWLPRFGAGWHATGGWLLSARLTGAPGIRVALPDGYRVQADPEPRRVLVRIVDRHGELAASGRVGLAGEWAVPDQILTEPGHRRRGLGSVLMARLAEHALAAGASRAVLGATDQGRALYLRLGWTLHSGLSEAYWRPRG